MSAASHSPTQEDAHAEDLGPQRAEPELLGTREPAVYGSATLADVEAACRQAAKAHGAEVEFRQSNHEGALIDWLHEAGRAAAGETLRHRPQRRRLHPHLRRARRCIKAIAVPVIEVHLSNVHAREPFRHHSFLSPACAGIVVGFGVAGYALAIDGLARTAKARADVRR